MDFLTLAEAVLVYVALHWGWQAAKNPKLTLSEKMAGYTYSVYFILLAAIISLSRISLVLAAKASSITAAVLLTIGLFTGAVLLATAIGLFGRCQGR